ncbi:MAG TPA: apolipoprotein N-acyltransferase [Rectinemataceae bacterium]|nr:apolipoprotein N-acyltransferase [Rectinemataceae bacterium]
MLSLRPWLLALSSTLLFTLGLPNEHWLLGFAPLGWVALVPLYLALLEAESRRKTALLTASYGAALHAASSYWLYFFRDFAFWTIGATTMAYFVIYYFLGLCLAFLPRRAGLLRPLAFAILWASFELCKSSGFLGYPWGLIPYTQSTILPLLQIADLTGVYGLSFLLALANASLAELLLRSPPQSLEMPTWGRPRFSTHRTRRGRHSRYRLELPGAMRLPGPVKAGYAALSAALILLSLGYGLYRLSQPEPTRTSLKALIIQQASDPWTEGAEAAVEANMRLVKEALASGQGKPDLVLFSESSLGYPFKDSTSWYEKYPRKDPFLPWWRQQGLWLFTGTPVVLDWKDFSATNSVMLIDPRGQPRGDYAKIHPVPFAEAIPFYEYPWFRDFLKQAVGLEAGWTMGTKEVVFDFQAGGSALRFGAPICFEDAFAPLCRDFVLKGADLLVNLTDDSWSQTKSAEWQHLAAARFRAIETRRPLVRSTNSGVSALVDARGDIHDVLPLFSPQWEMIDIHIPQPSKTLYLAFGEWFAVLCLLLSLAWGIMIVAGDRVSRREGP